jgi:hypothetical protein
VVLGGGGGSESVELTCGRPTYAGAPHCTHALNHVPIPPQGDIDGFDGLGAGCVVCLNAAVQCAFVPCFHAQTCVKCADEVRTSEGRCPVCRCDITGIQRIFLS